VCVGFRLIRSHRLSDRLPTALCATVGTVMRSDTGRHGSSQSVPKPTVPAAITMSNRARRSVRCKRLVITRVSPAEQRGDRCSN
jgi:hypothetical protein